LRKEKEALTEEGAVSPEAAPRAAGRIVAEVTRLLEDHEEYIRRSQRQHLYCDGQGRPRIARILALQALIQ